jgi:hypothetical protein
MSGTHERPRRGGIFAAASVPLDEQIRHYVAVADLGMFERRLVERFERCHVSSGGEVWVQRADALAALHLAEELDRTLLGMEGFIVGTSGVYPSLGRIADFSGLPNAEAYSRARELLADDWAEPPDDVHPDAEGNYMIDLAVAE